MNAILPLMALCMIAPVFAQEPAKAEVTPLIAGVWVLPGTYYKEVKDMKVVNPVTVTFTHSGGSATVRFEKLEPKWREALGYDAKAAQTYEAQLAAAEQERNRLAAAMAETAAKLVQKLEERERLEQEIEENRLRKIREQNAAIVNEYITERMTYWRIYGHDLGEYMFRQRMLNQRETDLRNAQEARFQTYGR